MMVGVEKILEWKAKVVKVGHEDDNNLIGMVGSVFAKSIVTDYLFLVHFEDENSLNDLQKTVQKAAGGVLLFLDELEFVE